MSSHDHPRDHAGMEVLDAGECRLLLAANRIGRVAFQENGEVMIFPVTYSFHSSRVCFRSAVGAKLDAALEQSPVAFEIDGWDENSTTGWSVVVKGRLAEVSDEEVVAGLEEHGAPSWLSSEREMRWVEVIAEEMSGRKLPGSADRPSD
ncbi:MAG TPA: pyridoxamine 5'-phosphate oxidase family protein [Acidimicrobiia bacterium]|jgi:nitroimidazol reductase NimA-like FMN-containing flavoprotein (pyridoxamine 5'-phosphate oxidase superfamily)